MEYTENNPLRVFTSFSGYDSQCMALDRIKEMHPGFDYELVGWSEIDRHAIKAHNLVYPQWAGRNFGDITKIDAAMNALFRRMLQWTGAQKRIDEMTQKQEQNDKQ